MATETKLIHINGAISEIETNSNNKIIYKLSEPLILQEGDIVSLYQSFLNVRGISDNTMLFTEDQEIIMRFYYWIPANLRKGPTFDDTLVHDNTFDYQEFQSYPANPYNWIEEHMEQEDERFIQYDERLLGDNNTPCILCDVMEPNNVLNVPTGTIIPRIGQKSIFIPKGTYSVDTLTKLFSDQCNGIRTQAQNPNAPYSDYEQDNAFTDQIFMNQFVDRGNPTITPQIDGFTTQVAIYPNTFPLVVPYLEQNPPIVSPQGKENVEIFFTSDPLNLGNDGQTLKRIRGSIFLTGKAWDYVRRQWDDGILTTVGDIVEHTENTNWAKGAPTNYLPFFYRIRCDPKEAFNNENTHDNQIVRYELPGTVGASEFILQYSGDVVNRFSFSNLHTPLKQPSHLSQATANPLSGNQMTKLNNNILLLGGGSTFGFYPQDCTSGIAVISFNWGDVLKTSTYQEIIPTLTNQDYISNEGIAFLYKFYYYRHEEWFRPITDPDPKKLWLNSFWYRLGFQYNQIGQIVPNLPYYTAYLSQKNQWQWPGFTTKNEYNLSQAVSSSGLGLGIGCGDGADFQNFGTVGIFIPCLDTSGGAAPTSNQRTYFNLEATSKFYNAASFPDLLGGKNYIIIHSNLIPNNYKSASYDGGSILGIASFEFSQLDTLFAQDEIPFTIQQTKALHQVFLRLTWPDGTDITNDIIGAESGFIIKILRPMQLPGESK